jgi:hypothetical protein
MKSSGGLGPARGRVAPCARVETRIAQEDFSRKDAKFRPAAAKVQSSSFSLLFPGMQPKGWTLNPPVAAAPLREKFF